MTGSLPVVTADDLLRGLRAAVEARGADYHYPKSELGGECVYTDAEGAPACIVGFALSVVAPEVLPELHGREWSDGKPSPFGNVRDLGRVDRDTGEPDRDAVLQWGDGRVQYAAGLAQSRQDRGGTWGYALEAAEAALS